MQIPATIFEDPIIAEVPVSEEKNIDSPIAEPETPTPEQTEESGDDNQQVPTSPVGPGTEVPGTGEVQKPETPEEPQEPETPEQPEVPETPEEPETPKEPQEPEVPEVPEQPKLPADKELVESTQPPQTTLISEEIIEIEGETSSHIIEGAASYVASEDLSTTEERFVGEETIEYEEVIEIEVITEEVPIYDEEGNPLMDEEGNPITQTVEREIEVPKTIETIIPGKEILKVTTTTIKEVVEPFPTSIEYDGTLLEGEEHIIQEGIDGRYQEIITEVTLDGMVIDRSYGINHIVDMSPQVIVRGTKTQQMLQTYLDTYVIEHGVKYIADSELDAGVEVVVTEGVKGRREVTRTITVDNNQEIINESTVSENIIEPIDKVIKVGTKVEEVVSVIEESVDNTIDFETIYRDAEDLPLGEERIIQEGVQGIERITYSVTYVNGVESTRVITNRELIQESQALIIEVGTQDNEETTNPGEEQEEPTEPGDGDDGTSNPDEEPGDPSEPEDGDKDPTDPDEGEEDNPVSSEELYEALNDEIFSAQLDLIAEYLNDMAQDNPFTETIEYDEKELVVTVYIDEGHDMHAFDPDGVKRSQIITNLKEIFGNDVSFRIVQNRRFQYDDSTKQVILPNNLDGELFSSAEEFNSYYYSFFENYYVMDKVLNMTEEEINERLHFLSPNLDVRSGLNAYLSNLGVPFEEVPEQIIDEQLKVVLSDTLDNSFSNIIKLVAVDHISLESLIKMRDIFVKSYSTITFKSIGKILRF